MFHTIVSIKNDGHYFCRAGGNRPDGLNEPVTSLQHNSILLQLVHTQDWTK
ncbi:TPA: copper resistance protein [Escherichia coli]|nr:copper resistance protein [Escherichia coli]